MVRVGGAPRRAAAKRCAYHTEQKSLERTFESIDPATIAEVLASHSGNMDLAAMDLVELDRVGFKGTSSDSSPDDKKRSGGAPGGSCDHPEYLVPSEALDQQQKIHARAL